MVSAIVDGQSHWYNRLRLDGHTVDIDVTGDQFGREPVQVSIDAPLYPHARVRPPADVNEETRRRSERLIYAAHL